MMAYAHSNLVWQWKYLACQGLRWGRIGTSSKWPALMLVKCRLLGECVLSSMAVWKPSSGQARSSYLAGVEWTPPFQLPSLKRYANHMPTVPVWFLYVRGSLSLPKQDYSQAVE